MTYATLLDQNLRAAGIPILGVSMAVAGDKATWRVDYAPEATAAHKTQGAGLVAAFIVDAVAVADAEAKSDIDAKAVKALAIWTANKLVIPLATMKAEVLAIYKGLP